MISKLLMAFILANSLLNWNSHLHILTTVIAENELKRMGRGDLLQKMEKLLSIIKPYTREKDHSFVESSIYFDDIKESNWNSFNKWHYYSDYVTGPGQPFNKADGLYRSKHNIINAIEESIETLKSTRLGFVDDRLGKSFELRKLIHLLGDLHQPLHNASFVDDEFKNGDNGGNNFKIDHFKGNLHAIWDEGLSEEFKNFKLPILGKKWSELQIKANAFTRKHTRESLKENLELKRPFEWMKEAKNIVIKFAYKGLKQNLKLTEKYKKEGKYIVEKQIVLGGYRLADTLIEILNDDAVFEKHVGSDDSSNNELKILDLDSEEETNVRLKTETDSSTDEESNSPMTPHAAPKKKKYLLKHPDDQSANPRNKKYETPNLGSGDDFRNSEKFEIFENRFYHQDQQEVLIPPVQPVLTAKKEQPGVITRFFQSIYNYLF
jgi:hypothetical protein